MATRPVFLPIATARAYTREVPVDFTWHAGLSVCQKQKSIASLHGAARARLGVQRLLEVSSKSGDELGRRLSAFNLQVALRDGSLTSVESAFQGSKVFSGGGPFVDLLRADPRQAKTDPRLKDSGALIRFEFEDYAWPLEPLTAFYDWLYLSALQRVPELGPQVLAYQGFTDIEFNPERSLNCQARSVALFCSLTKAGLLPDAVASPGTFIQTVSRVPLV
ncbi:conserved hypothetical protein [Rubrivivax sp. A210]|nr:conserved hypothetical protein [Rubrivivax sp. A210]